MHCGIISKQTRARVETKDSYKPNQPGVIGSQIIECGLTSTELSFVNKYAVPLMDAVHENPPLEKLADSFWSLCVLENDRAKILDQKASSLMGLASIAAAVLAMVGNPAGGISISLLWARAVSLALFACTVGACLFAFLVRQYGSFNDQDVFGALSAHKEPVGDMVPFVDRDVYRCFLKETILQRWFIYRRHCNANDVKANRVLFAQILALVSVLSLFAQIAIVIFS